MDSSAIISIEDSCLVPFGRKRPLVIERGMGVRVWDLSGRSYLDFTAGWAVTSLGHSHPALVAALAGQAAAIMQNPDGGLTYSPPRAGLLKKLTGILPQELHHIFFVNSGAEANDAALKLARKITGRKDVVATDKSFHGRTIGTTSVTGQAIQRDRYEGGLLPNCRFMPFGDPDAASRAIDDGTAAVIVEPIQGEGGIWVPPPGYLDGLSNLCRKHGALLIVDEIQTGFWRTGPAFASTGQGVVPDFLTMAKGIAGGFPFGAVAVERKVAECIEEGDHGGTYCGNPLGCAVAAAAIDYLVKSDIENSVRQLAGVLGERLGELRCAHPAAVKDVRGMGLLVAVEFSDPAFAGRVQGAAQKRGLILNLKHGTIIRIFPALTITEGELAEGLDILEKAVGDASNGGPDQDGARL